MLALTHRFRLKEKEKQFCNHFFCGHRLLLMNTVDAICLHNSQWNWMNEEGRQISISNCCCWCCCLWLTTNDHHHHHHHYSVKLFPLATMQSLLTSKCSPVQYSDCKLVASVDSVTFWSCCCCLVVGGQWRPILVRSKWGPPSGALQLCRKQPCQSVPNFFLFFCLSVQLCCAVLWPSAVINFTPYATVSPSLSFSYSLVPNVILIWFSSPSLSLSLSICSLFSVSTGILCSVSLRSFHSLLSSSNGAWPASLSLQSIGARAAAAVIAAVQFLLLLFLLLFLSFFFYASFKLLFSCICEARASWLAGWLQRAETCKRIKVLELPFICF